MIIGRLRVEIGDECADELERVLGHNIFADSIVRICGEHQAGPGDGAEEYYVVGVDTHKQFLARLHDPPERP
jgi:hypothetical protein